MPKYYIISIPSDGETPYEIDYAKLSDALGKEVRFGEMSYAPNTKRTYVKAELNREDIVFIRLKYPDMIISS